MWAARSTIAQIFCQVIRDSINGTHDLVNMVYVTYDSGQTSLGIEAEGSMIRWAEVPRFSPEDVLLATSEALAIDRCLSERGLDNCSLPLHRDTPVSLHQQLNMLRAASGIAGDPLIAVRVGLGLHPTSYGIAGLALLSSASLRHALQVVVEYGALLCLKVRVNLEVSRGEARLGSSQVVHVVAGFVGPGQPDRARESARAAPTIGDTARGASAVWNGHELRLI